MNIEILFDKFKNLLSMEEEAKHRYEHYIGRIDDESIKKQLIHIRDDEKKHVRIVKELIGCLPVNKP